MLRFLLFLALCTFSALAYPTNGRRADSHCQPSRITFDTSSTVSHIEDPDPFSSPFVCLGSPESCKISEAGLELHLLPPAGPVTRQGNVNNVVSEGATVNSTFVLRYGKVTFEIQTATEPGSVTAMILVDAMNSGDQVQGDEIDLEFLSSHLTTWQTNMFSPKPEDSSPHYGMFNGKHHLPKGSSTAEVHSYSIARDEDKIVWSIDGINVRTLRREDCYVNGVELWPNHDLRLSMGLWDASNPVGTSNWAGGPIRWEEAKGPIAAVVKSVAVECW
ncbi:cell wall glucanase [Moniliophthora roreri MCA 2997]|uniref:Cell wall glucanase n=1 Tax=Moniliophthora roreri (strain MCA 2997) TaxID=1381753 RepID=V2YT65_MONRO|nr:cell wall glucanase [Moniliophthora roreri MCA 2997]KAI3619744.1 cell wall glucanase [Moniliophthora roreri]